MQEEVTKSKEKGQKEVTKSKEEWQKEARETYLIVNGIQAEIDKITKEANDRIKELQSEAESYVKRNLAAVAELSKFENAEN